MICLREYINGLQTVNPRKQGSGIIFEIVLCYGLSFILQHLSILLWKPIMICSIHLLFH